MIEQEISKLTPESDSVLERIAQQILIAYAWVSGPAKTEQERVQEELTRSHRLEIELDSTSIVG